MKNPYDDIIDLPHHTSKTRPRMSVHDRAAQFSPFAALSGFESAILETGRVTDQRIELDDSVKAELNDRLNLLQDLLDQHPQVSITWFQPDPDKPGGTCRRTVGSLRKIDVWGKRLILDEDTSIPMEDLLEIDGDVFSGFDPR